jgi:hypothetical protein
MSKHKWEYVRTNSKGEAIFRKDTNESLEFVYNYLDKHGIQYDAATAGSCITIYNKQQRRYVYYWTTGRWSPRRLSSRKHFHSNGIADFVERYLNKYVEQNLQEQKEKEAT